MFSDRELSSDNSLSDSSVHISRTRRQSVLHPLTYYDRDHTESLHFHLTFYKSKIDVRRQYSHLVNLFPLYPLGPSEPFQYDLSVFQLKWYKILHDLDIDHTLIVIPYIWNYFYEEDIEQIVGYPYPFGCVSSLFLTYRSSGLIKELLQSVNILVDDRFLEEEDESEGFNS